MDQIARRREERRRELAGDFVPIFGNGEDANLAATMLVMAVGFGFGAPISKKDRPSYLAALERLPKGSAVEPRVDFVRAYGKGADRHWRVAFADGVVTYGSSRQFSTDAEANVYASDFLVRLRGEINRP